MPLRSPLCWGGLPNIYLSLGYPVTTPPSNSPDLFQLIWHSGKWHLPLFGEKRWFRLVPCFPVRKSKQRVWAPMSATWAAGEPGGGVGSRTKNRTCSWTHVWTHGPTILPATGPFNFLCHQGTEPERDSVCPEEPESPCPQPVSKQQTLSGRDRVNIFELWLV